MRLHEETDNMFFGRGWYAILDDGRETPTLPLKWMAWLAGIALTFRDRR